MVTLHEQPGVLLVDDNPQVLQALGMLFETMGWSASKNCPSEQALLQLSERDFDLAIIDLRMPDINGIELCRLIRSQNKENAPIIFLLSGYLDPQSQAEAESLGIQAILHKPIGLAEMKNVLKKFSLPCGG